MQDRYETFFSDYNSITSLSVNYLYDLSLIDLYDYSFELYFAEIHEFQKSKVPDAEVDNTEQNNHQNGNISEGEIRL